MYFTLFYGNIRSYFVTSLDLLARGCVLEGLHQLRPLFSLSPKWMTHCPKNRLPQRQSPLVWRLSIDKEYSHNEFRWRDKRLATHKLFFFFNFQKMRSRWFWGRRCIFVFLKGQYHVFPLVTSFQGPADGCLQSLCLHLNKSVLGHLAHCFFSSEVRFFVLCPAKAP